MQAGLWDPRRPFGLTATFWVRRKWLSHCPPSAEADSALSANASPEEEWKLYTPGPGTRRLLAWPRACSAWKGSHAQGLTQGTGYTCGCSRGWVLVLHSGAQRHLEPSEQSPDEGNGCGCHGGQTLLKPGRRHQRAGEDGEAYIRVAPHWPCAAHKPDTRKARNGNDCVKPSTF